ncbi:MAG: pseudouridine synthase, partial [Candidatus Binatia bacterium]
MRTQESAKNLENFLKKEFPVGYVRKLLRKNGVRINGQRAKGEDLVRPGDRIQLYIEFEQKASAAHARSTRPLDIVYEDESLLVINKPAGMAVHEGKTVRKKDTVLGILEANYRGTGVRPQLVPRLDKDTSGLLLVAKNPMTVKELATRFEQGEVEKEYFCLVKGRLL